MAEEKEKEFYCDIVLSHDVLHLDWVLSIINYQEGGRCILQKRFTITDIDKISGNDLDNKAEKACIDFFKERRIKIIKFIRHPVFFNSLLQYSLTLDNKTRPDGLLLNLTNFLIKSNIFKEGRTNTTRRHLIN